MSSPAPTPSPSRSHAAASFLSDAGSDQASVVSDPETGRQFLVVRLPNADLESSAGIAPAEGHANVLAAASLIRQQTLIREQLETERDALADQIAQDFEELHWLRLLAGIVSASHPTDEIQSVANKVLPDLAELIHAGSVVFVPVVDTNSTTSDGRVTSSDQSVIVGESIAWDELELLLKYLHRQSPNGPFVFNRDSRRVSEPPPISAGNVVAVPVIQNRTHYGWLIALNRVRPPQFDGQQQSDLGSMSFATPDVGLLTTAASLLGGHARNVELFRAEESLRVSVIETITEALDARDPNTCGHSRRVGRYAARIAERLGFSAETCERLYVTGLFHDIGKIGIPDEILKKADRLSDEEFAVIKQHPVIGHSILSPLKGLAYVLPGVLHHHERIDGRGYPQGLAGDAIPLDARILAVADGFDAMTANRSYRNGMATRKAVQILRDGARRQWDAEIVTAFLAILPTNSRPKPEAREFARSEA